MKTALAKVVAAVVAAVAAATSAAAQTLPFDRDAIVPMDATFRMMVGEDEVGSMSYATRFEDGVFLVEDRTEMQPNILETLRLTADPETFAPLSLAVDFAVGEGGQVIDLTWTESQAQGTYVIRDGEGGDPRTVDFDQDTGNALARSSVFGLAASLPLTPGAVYEAPWFASLSGQVENLRVMVGPRRSVTVPAGDFETTPLVFANVNPSNVLYVTDEREVVRIDVPAMNMRFERLPAAE